MSLIVTYHRYADVVLLHDKWCYSYFIENLVPRVSWLIQYCTYHHYAGTTQSRTIICWNLKRWSYWQVIMLPRNTGKNHKPIYGGGRAYKYAIIKQIKHLPFVRHNPRWTTPGLSWIFLLVVRTSPFLPNKLNQETTLIRSSRTLNLEVRVFNLPTLLTETTRSMEVRTEGTNISPNLCYYAHA